LRLVHAATGKAGGLGFWGGFPGKTGGGLPVLGRPFKHPLGAFLPGRHFSPDAHFCRCPVKVQYPACRVSCAGFVRHVLRDHTAGEIGAISAEPMQGTAGNIIPPEGFLRAVASIAREHDALFIADEMITGFGRTGAMWGSDHDGVVPDIMTVGKGVGGGYPLSCVMSPEKITSAKPWANPTGSSSRHA